MFYFQIKSETERKKWLAFTDREVKWSYMCWVYLYKEQWGGGKERKQIMQEMSLINLSLYF